MVDFSNPDGVLRFIRSLDFPYHTSGIFPSEMAYFLYRCEQVSVDCIIESGRYEGYSTAVIAAYGEAKRIRVVSIDWELEPEVAQRCRQRLKRYSNLALVCGDAFRHLPRFLRSTDGSIALLIDGPKCNEAIYLSAAAAAYGPVRLIAHHNVAPEAAYWYPHFAKRFPGAERVEDSDMFRCRSFENFRVWEREITKKTHRDLEQTSLMVSRLRRPGPDLSYLRGPSVWHTRGAIYLYAWWKTGLYRIPSFRDVLRSVPIARRGAQMALRLLRRARSHNRARN